MKIRVLSCLAAALGPSLVGARSEPFVPIDDRACTLELRICTDGTELRRDPSNKCEFPPCPSPCPRDTMTCPDGKVLTREPKNECEFPECPAVVCKDLKTKYQCRSAGEYGCHYMSKEKTCVHKDDVECPSLSKKFACKSAGKCKWKSGKCETKCREPDFSKPCPEVIKPVKCGDCEYDNICLARAAGQKTKWCMKSCKTEKDCWKKQICYKEKNNETGVCVKPSGRKCKGIAGLTCPIAEKCVEDPSDSCTQEKGADCMGVCINHGCSKPRPSNCKDDEFNPVMCGECSYGNPCLAKSAGVDPGTCRGFCPLPTLTPELRSLPQVKCGEVGCRYQSESMAVSVGFHKDQCVKDCSAVTCMKCPRGTKPVEKPGECCPTCVSDCSTVACMKCPRGTKPVSKPGECCPNCVPLDKCAGIECKEIKWCPIGEHLVRDQDGCCPVCKPKPQICATACRCELGYKSIFDDNGCCIGCEKENPCSEVKCPKILACPRGQEMIQDRNGCCNNCIQTQHVETGLEKNLP